MTRALLSVLILSVIGLCGGCHVCKGLHHKIQNRNHAHAGHQGHACHEGCGPGCSDGACGCPDGHCHDGHGGHFHGGDAGHSDCFEPFHLGHQGPPERAGVLSWLGKDCHPAAEAQIPQQAQPAPGPSAAGVSYPYYTNRGPRDFLASDPRGIGPNY